MSCPSCRTTIAAGASRCGACGTLVAIPTEGALAPDLSRMREIPGLRKQQRTWKDEVRDRVSTRRAARTAPAEPQERLETPVAVPGPAPERRVEQGAPEGTLVELGGDDLLSGPSPYAVTEKFGRGMQLDLGEADLLLGPPPAEPEAPEIETPAALAEEPVVAAEPRPSRSSPPPELRWENEVEETPEDPPAALDLFGAAPLGERVLAAVIDVTLWSVLSALVVYFASRVAQVPVATLVASPWLLAFLAVLGIVYGAWFTGTTGQTVGKIATGLRVVDEDGRPPGGARALVRAATGLVGIVAVGAGLVPVLLDPHRRAFHDRLASTRVVRA